MFLAAVLAVGAMAQDKHAPRVSPAQSQIPREVVRLLDEYQAALESLSVECLDPLMAEDLVVLEHGGVDQGWKAYRDGHIGEHMKEWKSLKVTERRLRDFARSGTWAYAAQESVNTIVTLEGKTMAMAVTETFIFVRQAAGWKIRHLHVSLGKKK